MGAKRKQPDVVNGNPSAAREIEECLEAASPSNSSDYVRRVKRCVKLLQINRSIFVKECDRFARLIPKMNFDRDNADHLRAFVPYLQASLLALRNWKKVGAPAKLEGALKGAKDPCYRQVIREAIGRLDSPLRVDPFMRMIDGKEDGQEAEPGYWGNPMSRHDYAKRLGVQPRNVTTRILSHLKEDLEEHSKCPRTGRVLYTAESNWKVLLTWIEQSKRDPKERAFYALGTIVYYHMFHRQEVDKVKDALMPAINGGQLVNEECGEVISYYGNHFRFRLGQTKAGGTQ